MGALGRTLRDLSWAGVTVLAGVVVLVLWHSLRFGGGTSPNIFAWTLGALGAGAVALAVSTRRRDRVWPFAVALFGIVASLLLLLTGSSYAEMLVGTSRLRFYLAHFGLPLALILSSWLVYLTKPSSRAQIIRLAIAALVGEVIGQAMINPRLLAGMAENLGLLEIRQHPSGVHRLWPPQVVAVTAGAVLGVLMVTLFYEPQARSRGSNVGGAAAVVGFIVLVVVIAAMDRCEMCLARLPDYLFVGLVSLASMGVSKIT